ncbi:MAG TPA: TadE/TadG family type IV pilus assembly protein [Sphingomicrobium sp.]|nr:TadE/TadG family type IV pilus assembly protein [Sphingomicrobium sp.]
MIRRLILDRTAASAAEFAMVLPLLILFLLGILDGGRYLWEVNKAEKATQAGARVAIVTDVLDGGLSGQSYVGQTIGGVTLTQGDVIPAAALGELRCTNSGCTCVSGSCPTVAAPGDYSTRFNRVFERMKYMKPGIAPSNVRITYRGSGLGFAGDPNGMEIAPLVTVELTGLQFRPVALFNAVAVNLPAFRTTLTAEDSSGSQSN